MSQISGRILDTAGLPIDGANILVRDETDTPTSTVSSNSGTFNIELEASQDYILNVTANGFADQVVSVKSPEAEGYINVELILINRSEPITISDTGTLTHTGVAGASVTVDKANFVDASGAPVTGDIQLTITPVDVSNSLDIGVFPGSFSSMLQGGTDMTPMVSLGLTEFEFTFMGQPVNLAPGATAELVIPINVNVYPDGSRVQSGDEIPLWSLNEETGDWTREGLGQVIESDNSSTGLALVATATHFSWWSCDVSANPAMVEVTVLASEAGHAIVNANAPNLINWRGNSASTTIEIGDTTWPLYIPANKEVCFNADFYFDSGSSQASERECVTAEPNQLIQITLVQPIEGPIDIIPNPGDIELDALNIVGFVDKPMIFNIIPVTAEISVNYEIVSGTLPEGMAFELIHNRLKIRGRPLKAGTFSFVVRATDLDEFTDEITFNVEVRSNDPNSIDFHLTSTFYGAYIGLKITSGSATIDWNDGSPVEVIRPTALGRLSLKQHTYNRSNSPGKVTVTASEGLSAVEELWLGSSDLEKFEFSTEVFKGLVRLKKLRIDGDNTIYGDVAYLPNSLEDLYVHGSNKFTGNVIGLPRSLTSINFYGEETLSGDIKDLPLRLKSLNFSPYWGHSTLTGDIKNLPDSIETVGISGSNTVYGNLGDVPNTVTEMSFLGENTISGTLEGLPENLNSLILHGDNEISGNLDSLSRSTITRFILSGQNTVTGDLTSLPPTLTDFRVQGDNYITGNIAGLPQSLVYFDVEGNNSVFGDLSEIKANNLRTFHLSGLNKISGFSANGVWSPMERLEFSLAGQNTLKSADVDLLLTFFNDKLAEASNELIYVGGSSEPRTSASDEAVLSLESKGYTVNTN